MVLGDRYWSGSDLGISSNWRSCGFKNYWTFLASFLRRKDSAHLTHTRLSPILGHVANGRWIVIDICRKNKSATSIIKFWVTFLYLHLDAQVSAGKTFACFCENEWHSFVDYTHSSTHDARGVFSVCCLTIWGHEHMKLYLQSYSESHFIR